MWSFLVERKKEEKKNDKSRASKNYYYRYNLSKRNTHYTEKTLHISSTEIY